MVCKTKELKNNSQRKSQETQPTPHPQTRSSPLFRTGDRISLQPTIRQYRMSFREIIPNLRVGDINSVINISAARSGGSARAYSRCSCWYRRVCFGIGAVLSGGLSVFVRWVFGTVGIAAGVALVSMFYLEVQSWRVGPTYFSAPHALFTALSANVPVVVSAETRVATARINERVDFM